MVSSDLSTMQGRLRYARKLRKLTVKQLAERSGAKLDTLKGHEARNKFDEQTARRYGRALTTNWMWLLHGEGEEPALTTQSRISEEDFDNPTQPGTSLIRLREVDITAGAGGGGEMPAAYARKPDGSWIPAEAVKAEVMFPRTWLTALGLDPALTDLVRVRGDSMSPEIEDEDWVFVDRRVHKFTFDDIYLIWDGFGIVVKSLALVRSSRDTGPRVRVLSANPKYPADELPIDDVWIIGRVHFRIGRIVRSR